MLFYVVSLSINFNYLILPQVKVHELQDQNHSLGQEINLLRSMVSSSDFSALLCTLHSENKRKMHLNCGNSYYKHLFTF